MEEDESVTLLTDVPNPAYVKLHACGLRFVNGISSRYDDTYDPRLEGIISEDELKDIIRRLNETITSFWPCNTCYFFGYAFTPCTLGLSLLVPNYCASKAEIHAQKFLKNISLKAKFYDRKISFYIVKTCCDSYVAIKYPKDLFSIGAGPQQPLVVVDGRVGDGVAAPITQEENGRMDTAGEVAASMISQPFQVTVASSTSATGRRIKES